jgi:hypothetical protein
MTRGQGEAAALAHCTGWTAIASVTASGGRSDRLIRGGRSVCMTTASPSVANGLIYPLSGHPRQRMIHHHVGGAWSSQLLAGLPH